jgi:amino acid permease
METMETLKILQQYDAMATITLVASLVTIFVFILFILLWNRYDEQEKVLRDTQSRLDKQMNKMETIYVSKPPKREDETDRQYEQRCRMMITNKAYNYVHFGEDTCSLVVVKQ